MVKKLLAVLLLVNFLKIHSQQNLDFELLAPGNYTAIPGWTMGGGSYFSSNGLCSVYSPTASISVDVLTTPAPTGIPNPSIVPLSPFGPNAVVINSGAYFTRMTQTFNVTPSNKIFQYAYWAFILNGPHPNCCDHHYFRIDLMDCSNNNVACSSVTFVATNTACAYTSTLGMASSTMGIWTPNWVIKTLDLSAYIGSCVSIELEAGTCIYAGHQQTIYFDANSASSIVSTSSCSTNATLTSIPANSYSWTGPGSFTSSNQSIITSTPGIYTISISNPGCANLTQTIAANVIPSTTVTSSSPTICPGMSATLTAAGAVSYSWSNGANTASTSVSPMTSTVYTVTATSGTCTSTNTIGVTVVVCTAIEQFEIHKQSLSISPNPSSGNIRISSAKDAEICLTDQLGKKVKNISLNGSNDRSVLISGLSEGIYFVSDGTVIKKLIVLD